VKEQSHLAVALLLALPKYFEADFRRCSILPVRSQLSQFTASDAFWWGAGIEDSFIVAPFPATNRTLDEYEVTEHYERWQADIDLMAQLGIGCTRYGIPWHRINPAPDVWDWDWSERALDYCLEKGLSPIVDLVHYGTPLWMENAFLHPDFPSHMAEFAFRAAEKFRGRIHWWTPLNEPRMTAWFCGKVGNWPPYRHGWRGFVEVMLALSRGIVQTTEALYAADAENVICHIDAANNWLPPQPAEPVLLQLTQFRENLVFLALDLVSGRVDESHALWQWLQQQGAPQSTLEWLHSHRTELDVIGINLYPMLSQKQYVRTSSGRARIRFPLGETAMVERIVEGYWKRYERPMLIGETAGRGTYARRLKWLQQSVQGVRNLRARGVPLAGYVWWPLFDLVAWTYRQGRGPLHSYIAPMGLYGLEPQTLDRIHTPLVEAYCVLAQGGVEAVGTLQG
jgi:beta-glucosidase